MTQFSAILVGNELLLRHAAETLLARGHSIAAVVTRNPELQAWARGAGLAVEDQDAPMPADAPAADWLLSVANLSILKPEMLARGRKGAINFHDGPLPRLAGLNAPVWAIIGQEPQHGVTWHMIEGGVDEGDILAQVLFDMRPDDTAMTLNAMRADVIVIRHMSSGAVRLTADKVDCPVLNAGDGRHEHPTQALLDALTIRRRLGSIVNKRVVICGDLLHSRVARSNILALTALAAEVRVCAPRTLLPAAIEAMGVTAFTDFDRALVGADVVMMLRQSRIVLWCVRA